jgi:hypothetical protein
MMKIAFVLLIVFATVGHYVSGQAAGLREYELQSCLSNCYMTYSPNKNPGEFYSCVMRCKREYEERGKRRGSGRHSKAGR